MLKIETAYVRLSTLTPQQLFTTDWFKVNRRLLLDMIVNGKEWSTLDIRFYDDQLPCEMLRFVNIPIENKKTLQAVLPEVMREHFMRECYEVPTKNGHWELPVILPADPLQCVPADCYEKLRFFAFFVDGKVIANDYVTKMFLR